MRTGFRQFVGRELTVTSQQLALCCHREVGNVPLEMLRRGDPRLGGLR